MNYFNSQLITCIGNKRKLVPYIEDIICDIVSKEGTELVMADLFSGSGVVARVMKKYASRVIANDLETYSRIINECYLANRSNFPLITYMGYKNQLNKFLEENKIEGISKRREGILYKRKRFDYRYGKSLYRYFTTLYAEVLFGTFDL